MFDIPISLLRACAFFFCVCVVFFAAITSSFSTTAVLDLMRQSGSTPQTTVSARSPYRSSTGLFMGLPYKKARMQNVEGNLFVDESCIDCDVCRWMCPNTYARKGIKAAVAVQPSTDDEKLQAYAAMIACPVGAIRMYKPDPVAKQAHLLFPAAIDPERLPGVMHLGYHSMASFGATPYLIKRSAEAGGSIMIDCPRFSSQLANSIEDECGDISTIILTHKDDVADHQKWKNRFPNLQRIIHRTDATADTAECEVQLEGLGEWRPFDDILILHTPGHTAGSLCIQFTPPTSSSASGEVVMFTGDHVAYSSKKQALDGFKKYNKGNAEVQEESLRLIGTDIYPFQWILPGHGRMVRFKSVQEKNEQMLQCAVSFEKDDEFDGMFSVGYL